MSSAPPPPNYRPQDTAGESCGDCLMNDSGRCWGYGLVSIESDHVCDSWASEPEETESARGGQSMDTHEEQPAADEAEVRTTSEEAAPEAAEESEQHQASGLEYRQRRADLLRGTLEHREFAVTGMECRSLEDGTIRMGGLASATEHWYDVGDPKRGGFRERISRSAFKRTLGEQPDVVLLGNHEGWPLARTKNGSLALQENARGLQWDADLDGEDPESKMVARKVDQGLVDQCSFAFLCTDDEWNAEYTERTIKGVSLHRGDVSIVTHGANEATSVTTLRSDDGVLELRAGKAISQANTDALTKALNLVAAADEAVDQAQPILASVLGVDNPDADDDDGDEGRAAEAAPEAKAPVPINHHGRRQRERLAALRGGKR